MNDPIVSNVKSAGALRTLTWTNLAAQSAEQISLAAVPIVAVMVLQAGAGQIGALSTAQTLPFLLLSIPMGVLADRWSRARLMVLAEGVRALSLLALWLLVGYGALSLGALALLGFIGAAGTVGFTVAAPALVPSLVPQDALARANARLELARSAAFAAGPALAGALVAWAGASTAFACATALSTLGMLLLLRLPAVPRSAGPTRQVLDELRHGAALVWRDRLLRPVMWTAVVWNLSWLTLQAAYVPYAMRTLGLSADAVGFTLGCYGAGMLIGAGAGDARDARAAVRHRGVARPLDVGAGRARDGGHAGMAHRVAGGAVVRAVRVRPAGVGGDHHHAASDARAHARARPGVGDLPHRQRRRAAARWRTRRGGRQPVGRDRVHHAGAGRLRGAGAPDQRFAGARAASVAGAGQAVMRQVERPCARAATQPAMRQLRSAWRSSWYTTIHGAPAASAICTRWIS
jgi:MFS family permease